MRLILFDIDGTLLMGKGVGREATRRAMLELFGTCGTLDMHKFGGKTDWQTLAEVLGLEAALIGQQMAEYERILAFHMAALIATAGVVTLPGAMEIVTQLRQQPGVLLGIVTGNVSTTAPIKLRAAGFDPLWFPVGAYGSEALHRNDLPVLALRRACQHIGEDIPPEQVVIIGDTVDDIACARALGAQAIAVTTGFASRDALAAACPDFLLDSLAQLPDILR